MPANRKETPRLPQTQKQIDNGVHQSLNTGTLAPLNFDDDDDSDDGLDLNESDDDADDKVRNKVDNDDASCYIGKEPSCYIDDEAEEVHESHNDTLDLPDEDGNVDFGDMDADQKIGA